jgi:hypothetical protein
MPKFKIDTTKGDPLKDQINTRWDIADTYLSTKREMWDEYEETFHNTLDDDISAKTKSQTFDPKLATYTLEREYRVMAQLMSGKVKAISKNDEGSSKLMNLILEKYILPNANAGWDFLTKCRMVDRYSNIYGNFFVMVDWDIKQNGYRGPDMWMIPIRDVFPQVGAVSLDDSEYIIVRTWRTLSFFKDLQKREGFKNVGTIVDKLKDVAGDKEARDTDEMSTREQDHFEHTNTAKGKGFYQVLSMYEKDRWVDYVPSADEILRDSKNPHDDGELPIVNKFSIPLVDDFIGMGDFERGLPMQRTLNSVWNLYLDAVKISIFPPVLLNKDNIASMSSIKYGAAAKWLVRGNIGNVAQTLNLTPQGINTFNNTNQNVNASIQNLFGTSDTSVTSSTDPGYGKTPEAIKMQASRQNSRDVTDRFYMEQFLTKVVKKFINLMGKQQSKAVQVRMFEQEIADLARSYPEIEEMWDEKTGKLTINKSKTGSILYDYEIVPGSTYKVDEESQNQNLIQLFTLLTKDMQMGQTGITSPLIEALKAEGKKTNLGELITRLFANSGLQDFDKIITDEGEDEKGEGAMAQHAQQLQQMIQMIQGGGNPNEIPSQPMAQGAMGQMPGGIPQGMPQGQPMPPMPQAGGGVPIG